MKKVPNLHKDLPYLPERKKLEKLKKLVCSIEGKTKYVIYIRAWKQSLNYGFLLKREHRVIHWYEYKITKRGKKWIWKRFL